jgi:ribosomal protein S18 acetylase RimI-like enzyme
MTAEDHPIRVEAATLADVDTLVDQWVDLARGQRAYDSHLAAETNRTPVREALARYVVADGVRVAREDRDDGGDDGDGDGDDGAGGEGAGDGGLLGFVMFGPEQGDYEQTLTRGVIHNLFVVPAVRGEGVGSALLGAAERALAHTGVDAVSLEAMAANDGARRFYERHGSRPHRVELEKRLGSDTHSKEDG